MQIRRICWPGERDAEICCFQVEAQRYCRVTWRRNSPCRLSAPFIGSPERSSYVTGPGTRMRAFDASFRRRAPPSMP